jgi:hypothetical protein
VRRDAGFLSAKLATARFYAEHFLALATWLNPGKPSGPSGLK